MRNLRVALAGMVLAGTGCGGPDDEMLDVEGWTPMSTEGQPAARFAPSAVWTGTEMVVFGGMDAQRNPMTGGGAYDPALDQWRSIAEPPVRPWNADDAWWTGQRVLTAGCSYSFPIETSVTTVRVGLYDPAQNVWTESSSPAIDGADCQLLAAWSGTELLVVAPTWARAYQPATNTWRTLPVAGAHLPVAVTWSGTELLMLGEPDVESLPSEANFVKARYSPTNDAWTAISSPPYRLGIGVTKMAGNLELNFGHEADVASTPNLFLYAPATDTWTAANMNGVPASRFGESIVWTGSEALVWGGATSLTNDGVMPAGGVALDDGAGYDPTTDSWLPMTTVDAPSARLWAAPVWTGSELLIWGGAADEEALENTGTPLVEGGARYHR